MMRPVVLFPAPINVAMHTICMCCPKLFAKNSTVKTPDKEMRINGETMPPLRKPSRLTSQINGSLIPRQYPGVTFATSGQILEVIRGVISI